MKERKLTKKLIKSHIPKKFFDGTKLNGVSLEDNSYDLFECSNGEFILRTDTENSLIEILRNTFQVKYVKRYFAHYHEYLISK